MSQLGERLKAERDALGLTLEEIQSRTKIQKRYLEGIERGDYSQIPGSFYARAFIRQYAESVGLTIEQLEEEYRSDFPVQELASAESELSRVRTAKDTMNRKSTTVRNYMPITFGMVIVVGLLVGVWFGLSQWNRSAEPAPDKGDLTTDVEKPPTSPLGEEEKPEEPVKPETEDPNTVEPKDPPVTDELVKVISAEGNRSVVAIAQTTEPVILRVTASGDCYMRVKDRDGKVVFEKMLTQGTEETFNLTELNDPEFNIGLMTNIGLSINDAQFEAPISPSDAVHQYIKFEKDTNS
ncbi:MAG: helix-turn-helix domain-containing protein [Bacilli bacterium]